MWSEVVVSLAVAISTIQANDSFFKIIGLFDIHPDRTLIGHVIKALPLFKADCMTTCKETLSCFSINIYKDQNGGNMCDLNRSSKKQSPGSFVSKLGHDYAEPKKKDFCVKNDCPNKEALSDHWYKFNSSSYKYFLNTTSWDDARQRCKAQGGDMASFTSETENKFVFEAMLYDLNITNITTENSNQLLRSHVKCDGSDNGLSMSTTGAKCYNSGSDPALSLDGSGFATIPRFDLNETDFTFAAHVYLSTFSGEAKLLEGFKGSSPVFLLAISSSSGIGYTGPTDKVVLKAGSVPTSVWTHIAISWSYSTGRSNVYRNGQSSSSSSAPSSSTLFVATDPMYRIGEGFDGLIKELVVVARVLTHQEINELKDKGVSAINSNTNSPESILQGAWIGFNDKTTEGTVQWSDGLPLTYKPNTDLSNTEEKDCGLIIKISEHESAWKTEKCQAKATSICKKNHLKH